MVQHCSIERETCMVIQFYTEVSSCSYIHAFMHSLSLECCVSRSNYHSIYSDILPIEVLMAFTWNCTCTCIVLEYGISNFRSVMHYLLPSPPPTNLHPSPHSLYSRLSPPPLLLPPLSLSLSPPPPLLSSLFLTPSPSLPLPLPP